MGDPETKKAKRAPVEPNRLEAFSDGVFAIIITLLVLEIHRPNLEPGKLVDELLEAWPSYLAYALAFLHIGVIWLNHHSIFRHLSKVNRPVNWINLAGLGTAALIPFPTGVLAEAFRVGTQADQGAAVVLYALVAGAMSVAWIPMFPYLSKHPELWKPEIRPGLFEAQISRPIVGLVSYVVAGLLGWFVHPLAGVAILVLMVLYHGWVSEGHRVSTPV